MPLQVLYEDNHCIAINKPAGLVSAHFQGQAQTADVLVKEYLKAKYHKPRNVFLGVVHRLDRPVSGVLLFARTSKAAARLSEQFRKGKILKTYWALIDGEMHPSQGKLESWLRPSERLGRIEIVKEGTPDARLARTEYKMIGQEDRISWIELHPRTGRKHQLRVQLADSGHPILGDKKYGARQSFEDGIALHARNLTFAHPVKEDAVSLTANPPSSWSARFPGIPQEATWSNES